MKEKVLLVAIVALAFILRTWNVNWDANMHLHPDERFLTMVASAIHIPASLNDYLDPAVSSMNPYNVNYRFFVYGTFPLTLAKIAAVHFHMDTYDTFTQLGRIFSALVDIITLIFVFGIVSLLRKSLKFSSKIPYRAAFLYAIAVYPIQISHFFATDTFLSCFMVGSLLFMILFDSEKGKKIRFLFISALFLGLAIATKVNAVLIIPLLLFVYTHSWWKQKKQTVDLAHMIRFMFQVSCFIVFTYCIVRIADPRLFADANWLHVSLNPQFLQNVKELQLFSSPDAWYPPSVQWRQTTVLYLLTNTSLYGLGLGYSIFVLIGLFVLLQKKYFFFWIITAWVAVIFVYQSMQLVKTMRYIVFLFPFFAIYGAFGLSAVIDYVQKRKNVLSKQFHLRYINGLIIGALFIIVALWTIAFMHMYETENTRVTASSWIYDNIPAGKMILHEYWDDGLPQTVPGKTPALYQYFELPVFDRDTQEKWMTMDMYLQQADYYVLSSGRAWAQVGKIPEWYPQQIAFYNDLFNEKTSYKKVAEFTSYPALCIPFTNHCMYFPDGGSEEIFTVYDHPKVMIYENMNAL